MLYVRGGPLDIQERGGGARFFPPCTNIFFSSNIKWQTFFFPKTHTIKQFFSADISNQYDIGLLFNDAWSE